MSIPPKYRIGTDGDRTWTLQELHKATDKATGEVSYTYTSYAYFNNLETCCLSLLDQRCKGLYSECQKFVEALSQAREEVLEAIRAFGYGLAEEEVIDTVREVLDGDVV